VGATAKPTNEQIVELLERVLRELAEVKEWQLRLAAELDKLAGLVAD
jgi:hypothetical protein